MMPAQELLDKATGKSGMFLYSPFILSILTLFLELSNLELQDAFVDAGNQPQQAYVSEMVSWMVVLHSHFFPYVFSVRISPSSFAAWLIGSWPAIYPSGLSASHSFQI